MLSEEKGSTTDDGSRQEETRLQQRTEESEEEQQKNKNKNKNDVDQSSSSLPRGPFLILGLVLVSEALSLTCLFPTAALFVAHLTGTSREKAGYTSGFLIGIYMLAQFLSCTFWGKVSDNFGRRPIMLTGIAGGAVAFLIFGFSTNLPMAMCLRFLHGLVSANAPIAKTMVLELTNSKNEAMGFGVLSSTWCVGSVLGPMIGGFLYDPCQLHHHHHYNNTHNDVDACETCHDAKDGSDTSSQRSLFCRYPMLLIAVAIGIYSFVTWIAAFYCLRETNPKQLLLKAKKAAIDEERGEGNIDDESRKTEKRSGEKEHKEVKMDRNKIEEKHEMMAAEEDEDEELKNLEPAPIIALSTNNNRRDSENETGDETKPILCKSSEKKESLCDDDDDGVVLLAADGNKTIQDENEKRDTQKENGSSRSCLTDKKRDHDDSTPASSSSFGWRQLFNHSTLRALLLMYVFLAGANIIFMECFPLLAISSPKKGGWHLNSVDLGVVFAVNAGFGIIANFGFGYVGNWFDRKIMWRWSVFLWGLSIVLFPCTGGMVAIPPMTTNTSTPNHHSSSEKRKLILLLSIWSLMRSFASGAGWTLIMIFIGSCAPKDAKGAVMGITQSAASMVRCLVPIVATPLYAWSIEEVDGHPMKPFPFNYFLVFIIGALLCWTVPLWTKF